MAAVRLTNISKSFGDVKVIKAVNLEIASGEFVVFVGPSGCGKSTLLRLICGLETLTSGHLEIAGENAGMLSPRERGIAMVFQSYALYPHMNVYDNMAFGLKAAGMNKAQLKQKIMDVAKVLQLDALLKRKPSALSGGQRQRVAIGRAIVREPRLFLFDEPLSNLDASLRVKMRIEILRLHQRLSHTTIYVTHDQIEAMTLADKIVVLNEGKIEQVGSPMHLYNSPENVFVAKFIGAPVMNILDVKSSGKTDESVSLTIEGLSYTLPLVTACESSKLQLGIRPEHLMLTESLDEQQLSNSIQFKVIVHLVEKLGDVSYLYARLETGEEMTIAVSGQSEIMMSQEISVSAPLNRLHLFDDFGKRINHSCA